MAISIRIVRPKGERVTGDPCALKAVGAHEDGPPVETRSKTRRFDRVCFQAERAECR